MSDEWKPNQFAATTNEEQPAHPFSHETFPCWTGLTKREYAAIKMATALGRVRELTGAEADVIEAAMELETLMQAAHYGPIPASTLAAARRILSRACASLTAEVEGHWRRPEGV